MASFNPRPRMGGDFRSFPILNLFGQFQSTPPYGGRLLKNGNTNLSRCFNPRPRMGGDTTYSPTAPSSSSFNPRPRMGGDPEKTK